MSWKSRTHCHNWKIENEFRKNKNDNEIFYIKMCQKHTNISRINRILLKIYHKFCWNHHIINWFIIKRQIISMNRETKTSISRNKKKVQEKTDTDSFQLWKISYYWCRCIRIYYESTSTTIRQSRTEMINHLLCMKDSWLRNASYCRSIKTMKSLFIRNKISNNYQIESQKFTVLYDNKKVKWMINTLNRNSSRIWFHHSTLQRKKQ